MWLNQTLCGHSDDIIISEGEAMRGRRVCVVLWKPNQSDWLCVTGAVFNYRVVLIASVSDFTRHSL